MLWTRLLWIPIICFLAPWGAAANSSADSSSFMSSDEVQQGNQGAQAAPDAGIAQRLAKSEIVILGAVTDTAPLSTGHPSFLSTHDPNWWRATISVESVEKGKVASKSINVLFSNSADVAWYRSPKLAKGDHAVWFLQNKDPFGKATPGLAVVEPLDVRPIADLEKVRAILKSAPKNGK